MMELTFSNTHFDGPIRNKWDVLLRIVGDFALIVRNRRLYEEIDFCLVEFAFALANWLAAASEDGPDFVYTSMESATEGLVRFTCVAPGAWQISAAYQQYDEATQLTTEEVKAAARAYITELRSALLPEIDLCDHIENEDARKTVRSWSDRP